MKKTVSASGHASSEESSLERQTLIRTSNACLYHRMRKLRHIRLVIPLHPQRRRHLRPLPNLEKTSYAVIFARLSNSVLVFNHALWRGLQPKPTDGLLIPGYSK